MGGGGGVQITRNEPVFRYGMPPQGIPRNKKINEMAQYKQ